MMKKSGVIMLGLVVMILLLAGCTSKGATGEAYKKNVELAEKELKATSCDGDDVCEAKTIDALRLMVGNDLKANTGCFQESNGSCAAPAGGIYLENGMVAQYVDVNVVKAKGTVEANTIDGNTGCFHGDGAVCPRLDAGFVYAQGLISGKLVVENELNATVVNVNSLCAGAPERDCNPLMINSVMAGNRVKARDVEANRLLLDGCIVTVNETTESLEVDC